MTLSCTIWIGDMWLVRFGMVEMTSMYTACNACRGQPELSYTLYYQTKKTLTSIKPTWLPGALNQMCRLVGCSHLVDRYADLLRQLPDCFKDTPHSHLRIPLFLIRFFFQVSIPRNCRAS